MLSIEKLMIVVSRQSGFVKYHRLTSQGTHDA
jgi:hypothetical protein